MWPFASLLILALLYSPLSVHGARVLNITNLENCQEFGDQAVVALTTVNYHIDPATQVCDTVHGEFEVKSADVKPRILTMTLYKCPDHTLNEVCLSNPTSHEETLGCDRMLGDDSGPWAMFSKAIAGSNCGSKVGVFNMDYSVLSLDHLINYLDIHDNEFGRYRMRMHFHSTQTDSLRACLNLDFKLLSN